MANLSPIVYDLEFTQNDDWVRDIIVWADTAKTIAFPFTDWTAIMQVKKRSAGNAVIATFKTSDGTMVLTEGNIHLDLAKANTDIPGALYKYDIEFKDADGDNKTIFETSDFLVKPDITDGSGL